MWLAVEASTSVSVTRPSEPDREDGRVADRQRCIHAPISVIPPAVEWIRRSNQSRERPPQPQKRTPWRLVVSERELGANRANVNFLRNLRKMCGLIALVCLSLPRITMGGMPVPWNRSCCDCPCSSTAMHQSSHDALRQTGTALWQSDPGTRFHAYKTLTGLSWN